MTTTIILIAIFACVLQVWGHVKYNRENGIDPNVTSWTIWGVTSAFDAWNYSEMTGNWSKNLLIITCTLSCLVTWVILLCRREKFRKFKLSDWVTLGLCGSAIVVWKQFDLVKEANIVFQVDNVISFLPIIIGVIKNPSSERPTAWLWWTASYTAGSLVVALQFTNWVEMIFPLGNAVLHFTVAVGALRWKAHLKRLESAALAKSHVCQLC